MSRIAINDLNPADSQFIDLSYGEINAIHGGGLWTLIKKVGTAVGEFIIDVLD